MSLFKNLIVYRFANVAKLPELPALEQALANKGFEPCAPTQEHSAGFVSPRDDAHGPVVESIGGELIVKLKVERKGVPGTAVKAELEKRCQRIEAETGRKPGRKEKASLKEEIVLDLLPKAFSKYSAHLAWIDRKNGLLVINAGSVRGADAVVGHLVEALSAAGLNPELRPLNTVIAPSAAMAAWLKEQEVGPDWSIGRELELKSVDEEKSVVRYSRHFLALDEIIAHIAEGKMPTRLSMTWADRLNFVLTADMTIKKVETLAAKADSATDEGFDGDVALTTGELREFLPALLELLGGEKPEEAAKPAAEGEAQG